MLTSISIYNRNKEIREQYSSMASSHSDISYTVFLSSILLIFSCLNTVHGRQEAVSSHEVDVQSLLPATTCSKLTPAGLKLKASQSVLQLHNKYSPCYTKNAPNHTEILLQDEVRVRAINSKIRKGESFLTTKKAKLSAKSGLPLDSGNFYVTLGFGSPKIDFPIIFDTGSDLTWIQCQPCYVGCYDQSVPVFEPAKSTSYSNVSCGSTECGMLSSGTGMTVPCSISACAYGMKYEDDSYSRGLFVEDTLTVSPSDVFPKFQFGCGQNNYGLFGQTAGILGLGQDKISFISQTALKYKKLFSYCLPSKGTGYLAFGVPSTTAKYIPIVVDKRAPSFYFLKLQGISCDGKVLSVFTTGGTVIDSGTVITRLPLTAYSAFSTAFRQSMNAKGYKSVVTPKTDLLKECYDLTGVKTVVIPKISLIFSGGISLDVPETGVLYMQDKDISKVCLAFGGNNDDQDVAIIGNKQQETLQIVYDVGAGRLGFGPGGCT